MNTTVNVLCYKSKKLSNGNTRLCCVLQKTENENIKVWEYPSVNPKFWDFEKERPKANCPNRELILKIIFEKEVKCLFGKMIQMLKSI